LQLDGDCVDPTIDPCSTYTKINAYVEGLNTQRFGNPFGPLGSEKPATLPFPEVLSAPIATVRAA
jgi:hypothetical protein